jgi:branched-chain amino acid transport system substrate-binding protein
MRTAALFLVSVLSILPGLPGLPGPLLPDASAEAPKPSIRLGGIFSLSGFGAHGGLGELRAAQLAVQEINAAGGIDGHKVELLVEDNQSDLKATAAAFKKLVNLNDIDALIGPNWSEFSEVAAPLAERAKVPMITPSGVITSNADRKYVFTLMQPPIETNRALAEALLSTAGVTEVVGLVQNNLYLENAWNASKQVFGDRVKVTEVRLTVGQPTDYRSILVRTAKRPGVAIYASLLPGEYAPLLNARRQLEIAAPVFAVDILYDKGKPTDAATNAGVVGTDFIVLGSENFHSAFKKRFGEKPLNYGAKAYDAARLLAESYVECGRRNVDCLRTVDKRGESGHLKFDENQVVVSDEAVAETYVFKNGDWLRDVKKAQ